MAKSDTYDISDNVEWDWGNGTGSGEIVKVYTYRQSLTIKGVEMTRNASDDCPAYRITTDDSEVLKSHTEVLKSHTEVRKV